MLTFKVSVLFAAKTLAKIFPKSVSFLHVFISQHYTHLAYKVAPLAMYCGFGFRTTKNVI